MQCGATVQDIFRKQQNFEWRDRGGVWILLFSEVTLFEYVSTILSVIVALKLKLAVNRIPRSSCGFCHEEMRATKPI